MSVKYYKVLKGDQSCHGGSQTWPLPTADSPGEWLTYEGKLSPCNSGLHVTNQPAVWFDRAGLSVYEVEIEGEQVPCDGDKVVCRKLRLVKLLTETALNAVRIFTIGEHKLNDGLSRAFGSATVRAFGSATVRAFGSATVRAFGSATVNSYGCGKVTIESFAIQIDRSKSTITIRHAPGASVTLEEIDGLKGGAS